jgi:hypothetical protein
VSDSDSGSGGGGGRPLPHLGVARAGGVGGDARDLHLRAQG